MSIQEVLQGALALNGEDKKYVISVEDDRIITTVKWMDAVFFTPGSVTDEVREFKFIAKLNGDKTWSELDQSKAVKKQAGFGGLNMSYSGFQGKQISFNKTVGVGKNRADGTTGVINITFNSEEYRKPVREYLTSCGYTKKKKGFFATLFGK